MDVDNKVIGSVAASVASAALGFGLASWSPWTTPVPQDVPLISHADCGVTSGGDIDGVNLSLSCGLSRAGWEEIVAGYLDGLNLDDIREGRDPTQVQLEAWGAKLGSIDAVRALLTEIKGAETTEVSSTEPTFRPTTLELNTSIPSAAGGEVATPVWLARTPEQPAPPPAPPAPQTTEGQALLEGAVAACGIAALRDIRNSAIEVECGATAEDIDDVITKIVAESGADSLIALLRQDAARRDQIVQDMAKLSGVDADLMAALVAQIEASAASGTDGAGAEIDSILEERMHQTVVLVRMGAIAGFLADRQSEAADALAAGDAQAVDSAFSSAATGLRRLADDLAPPKVSDIVAAARLVDDANDLLNQNNPAAAILSLEDASRIIASARPTMSRSLELAAIDILAAPEWRETLRTQVSDPAFDPQKIAAERRLLIVDQMRSDALTLGISAANTLLDRSEAALDTATLDEARRTLDKIARFVDPDTEPVRVAQLEKARTTLLLQDYWRGRDLTTLKDANSLAETALASALNIDEDWAIPYQTNLGRARLELGRATGDRDAMNEALDAFKIVAATHSPDTDVLSWASAQNNVAVTLQSLAADGDLSYFEESVTVFRQIAQRMKAAGFLEEWSFYSRNLAGTLTALGDEAGSTAQLREAVRALEAVLAYEEGRPLSGARVATQDQLAWTWSRIAMIDRNAGAYDRADGYISDTIAIYRDSNLRSEEIDAERKRLDFRWNRGVSFDDATLIARAADEYGILADRARTLELPELAVFLSMRHARATQEANRRGAATQGPTPLEIVESARAYMALLDPQTASLLRETSRELEALFRDLQ